MNMSEITQRVCFLVGGFINVTVKQGVSAEPPNEGCSLSLRIRPSVRK